jgi:hypothetical protein
MATHEVPVDGTEHDRAAVCPCRPRRRDRAGGGVIYAHRDRRPANTDAGREADCGHLVIDVDGEQQHHAIPDDDAPHAPTSECGCRPRREDQDGHVVYVHADPDGDADAQLWADLCGGEQ